MTGKKRGRPPKEPVVERMMVMALRGPRIDFPRPPKPEPAIFISKPKFPVESVTPDLRRRVAQYIRDEMVVVLAEGGRPKEPGLTIRRLPATDNVFPKSTRVAIAGRVATTWRDLAGADIVQEGAPPEITDGVRWYERVMLLGADALLEAGADLAECEDLRALGVNTLSAIGNLFSVSMRRTLLLRSLRFHGWNMPKVAEDFRLGGTTHVLRAIKDLGLEKELAQARAAGLVRRGGARPSAGRPAKKI